MEIKDMTIEQLRKYEEIKTARPRTDMILVRDLRKWGEAKCKELLAKEVAALDPRILPDVPRKDRADAALVWSSTRHWIEKAFNLEED